MRLRSLSAFGAFAVLAALLVAIPASGAASDALGGWDRTEGKTSEPASNYIVRLAEAPVVAYDGGVAGYKATKPSKKGEKINPNHPDVVKYAAYLDSRHDAAIAAVGGAAKLYDYRYSLNGFAAKLSAKQASALKKVAGVVSVEKDLISKIQTSSTPDFMGLTGATGAWSQVGGVGNAGEDVIIGIVDTGINAKHPSFSDRTGTGPNGQAGKLAYQQIPGWHGKCMPGEGFTASDCNQKLIGAQYFYAGFGVEDIAERDFPRRATTTATAATPPPRPVATTASRQRVTRLRSARSAGWRRARASPRTRSAGRTRATAAVPTRTASPQSTRPSPTAWT
jgi:subtilisin family serine protease